MKRNATLILLVATVFFHLNAKAYAQGITIKVTDVTLDKVFSMIQKQTSFVFVYSGKQLAGTKKVSVNVVNEKLEKVMEVVMDGQPLKYEIDKEYVIIKQKAAIGDFHFNKLPEELLGRVTNEKGEPVASATVTVKNSNVFTATDVEGKFILKGIDAQAEIVITCIGYETKSIKLTGEERILIKMTLSAKTIDPIIIRGSTGYQVIEKKHPGSFDVIDNTLLNRKISANILSRIEDLTPGVSFRNDGDGLLIRGRNSIYSNVNPLIVVDNFPYDGSIDNINPNDVENVTILKDAAASAQWGARAGNGVIVITTKKGRSAKPTVSFNTNFTFEGRPRLEKMPIISSKDAIYVENWLFDRGFYNAKITNKTNYPVLSPVQELLAKKRYGQISDEETARQISKYEQTDVRDDLKNYFYQPSLAQQYAFNVSGSTSKHSYFLSVGYDIQKPSLIGNSSERFTIRTQNTFRVTEKLAIDANIIYVQTSSNVGGNSGIGITSGGSTGLYPYADLVDDLGNALPITKDFRNNYKDTAGAGRLLDWSYKPYDEIKNTNSTSKVNDLVINTALKYSFNNEIQTEIRYQYQSLNSNFGTTQNVEAYSVRNLINKYYQPNSANKFPIPIGGIIDESNGTTFSNQARLQVSYNKNWQNKHKLNMFIGTEIRDVKNRSITNRIYGYQEDGSIVNTSIDYVSLFPQYYQSRIRAKIPASQGIKSTLDRFVSFYSNAIYSYNDRYILSASARRDEANLFGVQANQKGAPLWSLGIGWIISDEEFYQFSLFPLLKLRLTYGQSGNYSRAASGVGTIEKVPDNNYLDLPYANVLNAPNEKLRWEQNRILNAGMDFETRNRRLSGTIEFYWKNNKDLMAPAPIDPTSGLTPANGGGAMFFGNVASVKGEGYEVSLSSINIDKKIKWATTFNLSQVRTRVTEYLIPGSKIGNVYVNAESTILPTIGKPIYNFYGYAWGGLDSENGDPIGYLRNKQSKGYNEIIENTTIDELVYKGPAQAPIYGAIRNSVSWNNLEISTNITFRFGYYIRKPLLNYTTLFNTWTGSDQFVNRWQKTGDEKVTHVPSMVYVDDPNFNVRQIFYSMSTVPIIRGDHIRIEDLSLSYLFTRKKNAPFEQCRIYGYVGNLGLLLWKANDDGIDPLYSRGNTTTPRVSIGFSVTL